MTLSSIEQASRSTTGASLHAISVSKNGQAMDMHTRGGLISVQAYYAVTSMQLLTFMQSHLSHKAICHAKPSDHTLTQPSTARSTQLCSTCARYKPTLICSSGACCAYSCRMLSSVASSMCGNLSATSTTHHSNTLYCAVLWYMLRCTYRRP